MSAHNAAHQLFGVPEARDPGNGKTLRPDRSPFVVPLVSVAAETRTLARPTRVGTLCLLYMRADGGDITLTVTGGFNETGDTTFVFSDPGQFLFLVSASDGSNYYWRALSHHGLGNASPTEAAALDGLTASASEINNVADRDNSVVTVTSATLAVTEAAHHNKVIVLDRAAGIAVTLPAAAAGLRFRFIVKTTFTGAASIKSAASADVMIGGAILSNDTDNSVVRWPALASDNYDTIDLFGTANSTGGIAGQVIDIVGLATNLWWVDIRGDAAGTEATPFANTVP
jgi:hypothetical protein